MSKRKPLAFKMPKRTADDRAPGRRDKQAFVDWNTGKPIEDLTWRERWQGHARPKGLRP